MTADNPTSTTNLPAADADGATPRTRAPSAATDTKAFADWWQTAITKIQPNEILLRGCPIETLIGRLGFAATVWLLLRGEPPEPAHERLLEACLVAAVDHGPQAPSIAAARMAATCGVGLNNAVATGVNMLGDVHGGAGQQCMELLTAMNEQVRAGAKLDTVARALVTEYRAQNRYVPGFGHRFHNRDPRRDPIVDMVDSAHREGVIDGWALRTGLALESALVAPPAREIPMNIDGVTAIAFLELGFPPPLGRGLFVLSRSVGILAHAWEESTSGRRLKGPMPPSVLPTYSGTSRTRASDTQP